MPARQGGFARKRGTKWLAVWRENGKERSRGGFNALAAGVTVFELAGVIGASVAMIERHYGTLLDGAHAGIAGRLDALEAELEQASREAAEDV